MEKFNSITLWSPLILLCYIHKHAPSTFFPPPVSLKAAQGDGVQVDPASPALMVFWLAQGRRLGSPLSQKWWCSVMGSSHHVTQPRTQAEAQEGSQVAFRTPWGLIRILSTQANQSKIFLFQSSGKFSPKKPL